MSIKKLQWSGERKVGWWGWCSWWWWWRWVRKDKSWLQGGRKQQTGPGKILTQPAGENGIERETGRWEDKKKNVYLDRQTGEANLQGKYIYTSEIYTDRKRNRYTEDHTNR